MVFRIYPTRRGLFLTVSAVIGFFIAQINHNLLALTLSLMAAAFVLISFTGILFSLRRLNFSRKRTTDCHVGEVLNLSITCENHAHRARQEYILEEELPFVDKTQPIVTVTPSISSRSSHSEIAREIIPVSRGIYRLDSLLLLDSDPAGLFIHRKRLSLPSTVTVYPRIIPLPSLEIPYTASSLESEAQAPTAGNGQDFFGLREYHPGDNFKNIHWRSSAKRRQLLVRDFEQNAAPAAAVILWGYAPQLKSLPPEILENMVSLAASICEKLARTTCNLSIAFLGETATICQPKNAAQLFDDAMLALTLFQPGDIPLTSVQDSLLSTLPAGTRLFVITPQNSPETADCLSAFHQASFPVTWFAGDKNTPLMN